jgi:serine/threonine protein kinase
MTTRIGNFNEPVRELLLKCIVYKKNPTESCEIMPISIRVFENEINIQKDIFEKSFLDETTFMEPICPCILYSSVDSPKWLSFMQNTMSPEDFQRIRQLHKHDVGYIAMECMKTYQPLESFETSPNYQFYMLFAIHQLQMMHRIGYKHCDFHLNNILIDESYHYYDFMPGRAIIIDFCKSKPITKSDSQNLDVLIKRECSVPVSSVMIKQLQWMNKSHEMVQQNIIQVIESILSRPLRDYIPVLVFRGGNMNNTDGVVKDVDKVEDVDVDVDKIVEQDVEHVEEKQREGEWQFPSDDVLKQMFSDVIMKRMQRCNPETYEYLTNKLQEVKTLDDDYIERLFYAQFNGLIVPDKLP